jgi:hypothetical protein
MFMSNSVYIFQDFLDKLSKNQSNFTLCTLVVDIREQQAYNGNKFFIKYYVWKMEAFNLYLHLMKSLIANCKWQAAVGHWVSLCVCSALGWLIVYQLGILSLSCSQYSQTICWRGSDDNTCPGVRNTSSIGAWPNSLDRRPPWYCIVPKRTIPITTMGCRQCLPLSVVQLKGKHCRKPHWRNGVVDTLGHYILCYKQTKSRRLKSLLLPLVVQLLTNIKELFPRLSSKLLPKLSHKIVHEIIYES